ncbi:multicopper oxidase domain-containing protein [Gordonia sp. (in: high G+C Gram-positive bacteria)]|uniref:multicopper oxidase domain-containing protein n=1 Tax=Gordonia sp. (in: high G+C Gram-positive bacteria) TaxID=84139 RepID=UPI0016B7D311|nr:multicopper oxidase domain-containing protein [Gordonia sp. (in: high G+C Gram-positive bacteria)]NLG46134.1 multicopper oxidase domain-containing protein [Gordonia sp. (in: high G+C Gram-positive bacteria)]
MNLQKWNLRVGLPVLGWLVALVAVVVARDAVPASGWLMIHLLGLGAASNAVLIWSWYFTESVLHLSHTENRRAQAVRLLLFNVGAVTVILGYGVWGTGIWGTGIWGTGTWGLGTWGAIVAGATLAFVAVAWHGVALWGRLRRALSSRFAVMVRYYVAAAAFLLVGIVLGATVARPLSGDWHDRLAVAHAGLNLLGWIGITVIGTLVTLWPTILRTRMGERVERAAKAGLPMLCGAVAVVVIGTLVGLVAVAAIGIALYAVAAAYALAPHVDEIRRKKPTGFDALSVLAGVLWLLVVLVVLAVRYATAPDWAAAYQRLDALTPALLGGFLAQVLLGALSYLIPVVLGKKPSATQQAMRVLDIAGPVRVGAANAGLLAWVLPWSGPAARWAGAVAVIAFASFVPLVVWAAVKAVRPVPTDGPRPRPTQRSPRVVLGSLAAGVAAVVVVAAIGVVVERWFSSTTDRVVATGQTTTVEVTVRGMRFVPDRVEVPRGDRLVVELTNTGDQTHDLVMPNGSRTPRLAPGESASVDAGVIGASEQGWCSLPGHRQMGMVFDVEAVGGADASPSSSSAGVDGRAPVRIGAAPGPDFVARDPRAPLTPTERVHRMTLEVRDVENPVAPGITVTQWPYGVVGPDGVYRGGAPGPTLRGKVGDVFEITLVNGASAGHSIDFHAGALAPDRPMRTIEPGQSLQYRFTATRSGVWLYHCSTMPMSTHIANGMFGAVIIDPPDLPAVDREYLLVQSEVFLGGPDGTADPDRIGAERPDLVVFNGYANQYDHRPLTARVGERVRIWVLAAGPNRGTAFHVVGGQFDTVWKEGAYRLRQGDAQSGGSQVLDLAAAQGGFVELVFGEPGSYPFISHVMVDAERGAHGIIAVR